MGRRLKKFSVREEEKWGSPGRKSCQNRFFWQVTEKMSLKTEGWEWFGHWPQGTSASLLEDASLLRHFPHSLPRLLWNSYHSSPRWAGNEKTTSINLFALTLSFQVHFCCMIESNLFHERFVRALPALICGRERRRMSRVSVCSSGAPDALRRTRPEQSKRRRR